MDWEFESKTAGGETLNHACSDAFFGSAFHCEDFERIFEQPLTGWRVWWVDRTVLQGVG